MAKKILFIFLVTCAALGLRLYAAARLDVDYDEPVYLDNAIEYANYLRAGRCTLIAWSETTYEHPALYKILYGVAQLTRPPLAKLYEKDLVRLSPIASAPARDWNMVGRYLSVALGTVTALVLAFLSPAAGLIVGLHSLSIKYTSEVYLEALPFFTSLLCALCYLRWFRRFEVGAARERRGLLWLGASALCLGATAASKYVYCIVGLAVLVHFCAAALRRKVFWRGLPYLAGWGIAALAFFFLLNPYLWPHPLERLAKTLTFHLEYQDSQFVKSYGYPFWQPLRWLSAFTTYYDYHPRSALLINADAVIFALGGLGLPGLLRRRPLFFSWLAVGLLVLLIWNTKWPQYTMIILVPFSLSAAEGLRLLSRLIMWLRPRLNMLKSPHAL